MKKALSIILAIVAMFTLSIPTFAAEPTEELPPPVIIEELPAEVEYARGETLKYSGTVNLTTSSYTPIVNVKTGLIGSYVITCMNDGTGAVTFSVGTQSGSVNPGQGIQFTVAKNTNYAVSAKANWSNGAYPVRIFLVS